jgi:adenosylhomocysteine nucleosidase
MAVEVESLIEKITDATTEKYSGISYVKGKLCGKNVIIAQCGMGKVNAAVCAQTMILKFSPDVIINTGVAGVLSNAAKIGDIVIGESAVQHDFDLTPVGIEKGFIAEINRKFIHCTPSIVASLQGIAKKYGNCHTGTIATGDQFISCAKTKNEIQSDFSALACEMEGGSIAHVCALNDTNFCIVRTISDNADAEADFDFGEFVKEAAKKSVQIILDYLDETRPT